MTGKKRGRRTAAPHPRSPGRTGGTHPPASPGPPSAGRRPSPARTAPGLSPPRWSRRGRLNGSRSDSLPGRPWRGPPPIYVGRSPAAPPPPRRGKRPSFPGHRPPRPPPPCGTATSDPCWQPAPDGTGRTPAGSAPRGADPARRRRRRRRRKTGRNAGTFRSAPNPGGPRRA